jgi:tyrosyl-tRNA synthetase
MADLDEESQNKFEIITRRLQEVLGGDLIRQILADGKAPKGYWGESKLDKFWCIN